MVSQLNTGALLFRHVRNETGDYLLIRREEEELSSINCPNYDGVRFRCSFQLVFNDE